MVPYFHRTPLGKSVRIHPFHIAVPQKITVRVKIDRIERNRLKQFHQPLFVFRFFPEDLSQFAASGEPEGPVCSAHDVLFWHLNLLFESADSTLDREYKRH